MNLKELKKMIAEEYNAFQKSQVNRKSRLQEQAGLPTPPTINVSDKDVDADGENPLDTLKQIYDMLKDFFEGGDNKADDAADDAVDDVEDIEEGKKDDDDKMEEGMHFDEDEKDLKEGHCYGEDGKPMPEGHCYEEDGSLKEGVTINKSVKVLQERFKKLANIIK